MKAQSDLWPGWRRRWTRFASSHNPKKEHDYLKTKNKQNCEKIELHANLTSTDLKKKHSLRLVAGEGLGSWGREDALWQRQAAGWGSPTLSHVCSG